MTNPRRAALGHPASGRGGVLPAGGWLVGASLRAVQPAVELDRAGLFTLSSHGSTALAILPATEALLGGADCYAEHAAGGVRTPSSLAAGRWCGARLAGL